MDEYVVIDSHQHFWHYDPQVYDWIEPGTMSVLQRDYLPLDLQPEIRQAGVHGTIAVQAEQSDAHTELLLKLAEEHDWIRGVVGWTDLRSPKLDEKLSYYSTREKLVGFRHVLQAEPIEFMQDDRFITGLEKIHQYGFTYDLLVYWHQLDALLQLLEQMPEDLLLVLDHLGKPNVQDGRILKWTQQIKELAQRPNTYCKLSGLVTEAHWKYWTYADLSPYLQVVMDAFGPDRCMFGSDWPVCLCAADSYRVITDIMRKFMKSADASVHQQVFGTNCLNFYGLK